MSEEPRADLLEAALEALEEGGDAALERFVAAHPEHAEWLNARLESLQRFGVLRERPAAEPPPKQLGEFELREKLGGGGMGLVYRAWQPSLARDVALKVIRPEHLFFAGARQRFRREVESIARLQHPHIVRVYEADDAAGLPWFTMELVDGVSLDVLLAALQTRGGPPSQDAELASVLAELREARGSKAPLLVPQGTSWIATCFRWALDLAGALEYAHALGVMHRDVKPANVMVDWSGRVMLLDFGLATTRGAQRITGSGALVGSLTSMAPEQLRGARDEVDPRTDVYGLGVTLYEMLSLRHPFHDSGQEFEETRHRILEGQPPSLRHGPAAVPWDAETVCLTAMERDRARRYPTAAAFAADLAGFLQFRPIAARRPGAALRLRRFTQRHPAWSVGAVLGFVLVAGGPLGLWWSQVVRTRAVTREQQRTQAALVETAKQRSAAESRFELALDAVTQVVTRIGAVELRHVPDAGAVRLELLELAEKQAQQLLSELPDHPRARHVAASVDQQLATVLLERSRFDDARLRAERAIATLGSIDDPAHAPKWRLLVGICRGQLARADQYQSRWTGAADHYAAAMELHRQCIDATEDVATQDAHKRELANCLMNWGSALAIDLRRRDEGGEALAEACDLLEEIGASPEDSTKLGQALANVGTIYDDEKDYERYGDLTERAVGLFRAAREARPTDSVARESLARGLMNLANSLGKRKQYERSLPMLDESADLFRGLCRDFPERTTARSGLACVLSNQGAQLFDLDEIEPAIAALRQSLDEYGRLVALPDATADLLADRALVESHLGVALREAGESAEAQELLRRASEHIEDAARRFPQATQRIGVIRRSIESNAREDEEE